MIRHHPSDESILAYANGSLKRPLALALGAHVERCVLCRESLAMVESLGGRFLEAAMSAEMSEDALAHVMERLDGPLEKPLASRAKSNLQSLAHAGGMRWLAPGIWIRPILKEGAERAYLMGAGPGRTLPRHGHKGIEMTLVLEGEFFESDLRYGPGDFLEAGDEIEHALLVGPDRPCVCLVASEGVPRGLPGLLMRLIG